MRTRLPLALAIALTATLGCKPAVPPAVVGPTPRPVAKASPGVGAGNPGAGLVARGRLTVPQTGARTQLSGQVRLVVGGIVSNNGGRIVSNNGGRIISDNGGGIISDKGGGLVARGRWRLQAADAAEVALADAVITFEDAAGAQLVDEVGKPISATTDGTGAYTLDAVLPARNLVARVALTEAGVLKGGTLAAMVLQPGPGALPLRLDTASSLSAAFVLDRYVAPQANPQATFDRLPKAEGSQLATALAAATAGLTEAPSYKPADQVALTERLRGQAPPVDQALERIEALLLGQVGGGDGRLATTTALFDPLGLALGADGELIFAERTYGRLRTVGKDGRIGTLADVVRGKLATNFPYLNTFVRAADGTIYAAAADRVMRLAPDGTVTSAAGNGTTLVQDVPLLAADDAIAPLGLAMAPDGTLYIVEDRAAVPNPRLLAREADGRLRRLDLPGTGGQPIGVAVGPGGALLLVTRDDTSTGRLWRRDAGGTWQPVAEDLRVNDAGIDAGLTVGADGTIFVSEHGPERILAIAPDGTRRIVAGAGGPPGTSTLQVPGTLLAAPDGTLYVSDREAARIFALAPAGAWREIAGSRAEAQVGSALTDLPLNAPTAAVFDPQGRLVILEAGSETIKRFDGRTLETIRAPRALPPAGRAPQLDVTGLAVINGAITWLDRELGELRGLRPDGTEERRAGGGPEAQVQTGETVTPGTLRVDGHNLAADRAGHPFWFQAEDHQIWRDLGDGAPGPFAGRRFSKMDPAMIGVIGAGTFEAGAAKDAAFAGPQQLAFDAAGALYLTDSANQRVWRIPDPSAPAPRAERAFGRSLTAMLGSEGTLDTDLFGPAGIAFDAAGNTYISELGTVALPLYAAVTNDQLSLLDSLPKVYARVRKIAPDGTITTVVGPGSRILADPRAEDALVLPEGLAIAPDGRMAIIDPGANRVVILPAGSY